MYKLQSVWYDFFFQEYNWKYHLSAVLCKVIKCPKGNVSAWEIFHNKKMCFLQSIYLQCSAYCLLWMHLSKISRKTTADFKEKFGWCRRHSRRNHNYLFQKWFQITADAHPGVSRVSKDQKFCEKYKNTHCQVDHPAKIE